jgi:hypothetical protein
MQLNWKLILIGGLAFYFASWLVAPISMPLIHDGVLADDYLATSQFWRPELMNDNMGALMPRWIVTGLIGAFISAAVYGWVRSAFSGAGWMRGLKYGAALSLLAHHVHAGLVRHLQSAGQHVGVVGARNDRHVPDQRGRAGMGGGKSRSAHLGSLSAGCGATCGSLSSVDRRG